jgi:putative ABC transport system permease protein
VLRASTGIDLTLTLSAEPRSLAFLAALALAVTVLAGAYPALVLSRVRPIFALRAVRARTSRRLLLTLLVGVQYAAASFLLIAATFVYLQNAEVRRTNLAISADPLLVVQNVEELTRLDSDTLREELLRLPQVSAVTVTNWSGGAPLPLAGSADETALQRMVTEYLVSYDFPAVFDLELLAGRFFERDRGDDAIRTNVVIDRRLAEFLGFATPADAIGQFAYVPGSFMQNIGRGTAAQPRQIIGVVENKPLGIDDLPATEFRFANDGLPYTIARISRDDIAGALASVGELWQRLVPGIALDARLTDDMFEQEYARYSRIAGAFTALCSFAMLIAVIGLFAMAQVVSARRTHEIGVRKTLGAGTLQMVVMLINSLSLPVVAGSFVASLLGFFAMRRYLDGFLSPVELDVAPFAACLLAMLLIASVAVGAQTLRAARATPAQVLRNE